MLLQMPLGACQSKEDFRVDHLHMVTLHRDRMGTYVIPCPLVQGSEQIWDFGCNGSGFGPNWSLPAGELAG